MRITAAIVIACALTASAIGQTPVARPLLIVAPDALKAALDPYAAFKKTIRPVRIVGLETILASTPGVDDPEKLKRYLYDEWRKRRIGYVLLVGDRDVMPIRFMTTMKFKTFDYLFLPTDLYYADLARDDGSFDDWNGNKSSYHNTYFAEVNGEKGRPLNADGIHYRPQIAVGRWPVSTPEAVRVIADKSIAYETSILNGTHPGLRTAAMFHVDGWIDAREDLSRMARSLPPGWKAERFLYQDGNRAFRTPAPTAAAVTSAFNRGVGLLLHVGHGETDSWIDFPASTTVGSKTHLNAVLSTWHGLSEIKNAGWLPVVISIGCSTAYFAPLGPNEPYIDVTGKAHAGEAKKEHFAGPPPAPSPYQPGKLGKDSLGKQLLENGPDGAAVYIGSDMVAQPMGLHLLDGFVTGMRTSRTPTVGDSWSFAVRHYYDAAKLAHLATDGDWVVPATFSQAMKFNVFGDPSLPLAAQTAGSRGR